MWKVFNFRSRYLVYGKLGGSARVSLDMFLEHERVRVALLADQTLVKRAHGRPDLVHAHVGLQITFGGESSLADLTTVGSLACVGSVVHLQS